MDSCPSHDLLTAYLLDKLTPGDCQVVDAHVNSCKACAAAMAGLCEELALGSLRSVDTWVDTHEGQADTSGRSRPDRERFRELYSHAKGGLGEIFVAHDSELDRNVALKRMQPRHIRDGLSRLRFELEAEVTGKLEHPGIVPVYSKGADDLGRPYYAMRLIRGITLKQEIDEVHAKYHGDWRSSEAKLRLHQLLRRLIDICNAVEYAHHRGVLHRDLKPANIMLGKFGETMVVDWGLAKTSDPKLGHDTDEPSDEPAVQLSGGSATGPTTMGTVVGTLGYMSPEQASARPEEMGPASDIYSLGAILYRLLAGRSSQKSAPDKMSVLRRIEEGRFAEPRHLNHSIPPPLQSICLKAMATDPKDRFHSARSMAADIESWMADERVQAHPENIVETSLRLARRYRAWVAASVALMLVASAVGMAVLAVRDARRSERLAALYHMKTRDVVGVWLLGAAEDLRNVPQAGDLRRQLIDRGIRELDSLQDQDPASFSVAPLAVEQALSRMQQGDLYSELGNLDQAETSFLSALNTFSKRRDTIDDELRYAGAHMKLAGLAADRGQRDPSHYDQALAVYEQLRQRHPSDVLVADELARCLTELGMRQLQLRELESAEGYLAQAVEELEAAMQMTGDADPTGYDVNHLRFGLCFAQRGLGDALLGQPGRLSEAEARFNLARESSVELLKFDPNRRDWIVLQADTDSYFANLLRRRKQFEEERQVRRKVLATFEHLAIRHPHDIAYREAIARTCTNLAQTNLSLDGFQQAQQLADRATRLFEQLVLDEDAIPRYRIQLAGALHAAAQCQLALNDPKAALAHCANADAIFSDLINAGETSEQRQRRANNLRTWGEALHRADQNGPAREKLNQAVALLSELDAGDKYAFYRDDLERARAARAAIE